jgi:hypothetical protein
LRIAANFSAKTLFLMCKKISIKIYEMIKKHSEIFHFSDDFLAKIEKCFTKKEEERECIIINPVLDDLFENNVYKLKMDEYTYIIPLWHHELIYDHCGNDIYINCFPLLPENVSIDENNDIHVELEYDLNELWGTETMGFSLGNQTLSFSSKELFISKKQSLRLKKQGISRINTVNIYDISKKGDIILHISIK